MRIRLSLQEYNLWQAKLLEKRRQQGSGSPSSVPEGNPGSSSSHLQPEVAEQSPSLPAMHSSGLSDGSTLTESNPPLVMGVDGGESGRDISPFFEGEETVELPRFDSLEDIIASLGINEATTTIDLLQGRSGSGAPSPTSPQPPELSPQNSYSADFVEPLSPQMQLPILENSMEQWGLDGISPPAAGIETNQLGLLGVASSTSGASDQTLEELLAKSEASSVGRSLQRKQKSPRSRRGRMRGTTSSRSIDMDDQLSPRSQLQAQVKEKREHYAQLKPHSIKPSNLELAPVKNQAVPAAGSSSPINEEPGAKEEILEKTITSSDENPGGRLPSFDEISHGFRQRRSVFTEVVGIDGSKRYAIEGDNSLGSPVAPNWESIEVEAIGGGGVPQSSQRGDNEVANSRAASQTLLAQRQGGGLSGINLLQQYLTAPPQNRTWLRQSLGLPPAGYAADGTQNSGRLQQAPESSSASLVRSGVESILLALRTSATIKKAQQQQQTADDMGLFKTPFPVTRNVLLNSRQTPLQRPERSQSVLPSLVQASHEQIQRLKAGLLEPPNSGEPSSASNELVRRARQVMWAPPPQFPRYPQNSLITQQGQLGSTQNIQPYPIPSQTQSSQLAPFQSQLGGYPPLGNSGGMPPNFQRYQQLRMQQAQQLQQQQAPFLGQTGDRPMSVGPSPTPNPMRNGAPPMDSGGAQFMQNQFNRMQIIQPPPGARVPNPYLQQQYPFQNSNLPQNQVSDNSQFTNPKGRRGEEGAPIRERVRGRPNAEPYQIPDKYGGRYGNNPNFGVYNNGGNRLSYGQPQQTGGYPIQFQQQQISPGFQQQQQQQQISPALLQRYQQMLYNQRLNNYMGATQRRPEVNNYPQFYPRPQEPPQYQQQFAFPPGQQQQLLRYGSRPESQYGGVPNQQPVQQHQPIMSRPNFEGPNHAQGRAPSPATITQQQFVGGEGGNMEGQRGQHGSPNAPGSGSPVHQAVLAGSSEPQRVHGGENAFAIKATGPQSPASRPGGLGGAKGSSTTGGKTGGFSLPIVDSHKPESPSRVQPPGQFSGGQDEPGVHEHGGEQSEHLQRVGGSSHSILPDADRSGMHSAWKPTGNGNNNGGPSTHHPVIQPPGNANHPVVEPIKISTPPATHEKLEVPSSSQQSGPHLPHHRDMPLHSQSELDAHHRRLLANAGSSAKDSEFENNSAILSWYLQRAKQELRNKQESGAQHGGDAATGVEPLPYQTLHSPSLQHVATPHSPGLAHGGTTPEHNSPSVQPSPASPPSGGLPKKPTPPLMVQTPPNQETLHGHPSSNGLQSPSHQNGLSPVAAPQNAPTPPGPGHHGIETTRNQDPVQEMPEVQTTTVKNKNTLHIINFELRD